MINSIQSYRNTGISSHNYSNRKNNTPSFGSNFELKFDKAAKEQLGHLSTFGGRIGNYIDSLKEDLPALIRKIVKNDGSNKTITYTVTKLQPERNNPGVIGKLSISQAGKDPISVDKPIRVRFIKNPYKDIAPHGYTHDAEALITESNNL